MTRTPKSGTRKLLALALLAGAVGTASTLTFISSTRFETGNALVPSSGGHPASTAFEAQGSRAGVVIPRLVMTQQATSVDGWEEY